MTRPTNKIPSPEKASSHQTQRQSHFQSRRKKWKSLQVIAAIFLALIGLGEVALAALCPRPANTICADPDFLCSQILMKAGAEFDNSGFRFVAHFSQQGQLSSGPRLEGVIRWYSNGVAIGDSELIEGPGRESDSILQVSTEFANRLKEEESLGITHEIFAKYLGDEIYSNTDVLGPPFKVAFEGSACFVSIPKLTGQHWQDLTITADKPEIEFADTVEVTATWTAVDHDLNVLKGRLFLRQNGKVLGEGFIHEKTGEIYHPKVSFSTLGLGEHTFDASYVGPEGGFTTATSETITVRHPRRPLVLQIGPKGFVAKSGVASIVEVCAKNRDGNLPTEIEGHNVHVTIELENGGASSFDPITASFGTNGCAVIDVASLASGKYRVSASLTDDDRFLNSSDSNVITVVPSVMPDEIAVGRPSVVGASQVTITLFAPSAVDEPGQAQNFQALSPGLVLQAEVSPAGSSDLRPGGGLHLLINGTSVTAGRLINTPSGVITFGPLTLTPGSYTATLVYTGDDDFAPHTSDNFAFLISNSGSPSFSPHPALVQDFEGVRNDFEVLLSSNVDQFYAGRPVLLTAVLRLVTDATPNKGLPVGTMVFKNGSEVLGDVRLSGFSGSIRLPEGLPHGSHDLHVDYIE